jgi:hypothetical protein
LLPSEDGLIWFFVLGLFFIQYKTTNMKSIIPFILLALLSCNNKKETMLMPGAYNMLSSSVFDGEKDTTYTTLKEFKIYTYDYMMYVNISPKDSVSRFGIGAYSADSGKVIENIIYGATDSASSSNPATFTLLIEKTDKGYKQVIPVVSRGKKYQLTEDYEAVSTPTKTPLDGAWKLTKAYRITGKDTAVQKLTQFKTFFAGHFMFGHTYLDSANRLHTGIGYGTFELHGKDKLKEHVETTTYYQIRGKAVDIDIEMKGNGAFIQTITNTDGTKNVEEYQLLKK